MTRKPGRDPSVQPSRSRYGASYPAIPKVAAAPDFRDSQIVGKMIHHTDEALAVPSGGFESRLRRLSGSPEGVRRQYRHGGFRPVGLRDVFHAERFFPILSTCSGDGQGRSNCQSLFGIEKIPSDNYIRDMLDEADPALLACFERLESLLVEPPLRQAFGRLGGVAEEDAARLQDVPVCIEVGEDMIIIVARIDVDRICEQLFSKQHLSARGESTGSGTIMSVWPEWITLARNCS
jgi:hypothetical protein